MAKTKRCSCCKKVKSWDKFYLRSDRKTPQCRCKDCVSLKQKEYYQKNKEVIKPKKKQYARMHREQMRAYEKDYRQRPEAKIKKAKYSTKRLRKNKQKAVDYKGGKCSRCGYHACLSAMEFHHIDPSKKEEDIHKLMPGIWLKTEKELDKCILLCSNCHRELHSGLNIIEVCNE